MVTQYPYTLEEYQVADAVLGTTGDWSQPDATWVAVSVCRDEGNGGGRLVKLTDGTAIVYSALIQLPKTCPDIPTGARVRVLHETETRLEGTVLRFQKDQLHSRLWV